jgi:hypothetical protein
LGLFLPPACAYTLKGAREKLSRLWRKILLPPLPVRRSELTIVEGKGRRAWGIQTPEGQLAVVNIDPERIVRAYTPKILCPAVAKLPAQQR